VHALTFVVSSLLLLLLLSYHAARLPVCHIVAPAALFDSVTVWVVPLVRDSFLGWVFWGHLAALGLSDAHGATAFTE